MPHLRSSPSLSTIISYAFSGPRGATLRRRGRPSKLHMCSLHPCVARGVYPRVYVCSRGVGSEATASGRLQAAPEGNTHSLPLARVTREELLYLGTDWVVNPAVGERLEEAEGIEEVDAPLVLPRPIMNLSLPRVILKETSA